MVEVHHLPRAHRLRLLPEQRARLRRRGREAARARGAAEGDVDANAPLRAEPDPLAPRLARHVRARARRDLDVLVRVPRARADPRPVRARHRLPHAHALLPGRRARRGHPARLLSRVRASSATGCRARSTTTRRCSHRNKIWLERTEGLGLLSAEDAIALGQSGPVLRGSGVDWDLRKRRAVPRVRAWSTSTCPCTRRATSTRATACTWTRCASRCASSSSASTGSSGWTGEPWIADDRKVVLPPRHELHTSMESLIHHFKIVTEGFRVPEGEVVLRDRVAARRARLLRRARTAGRSRGASSSARRRSSRWRRQRRCMKRRADRRHDRDRRLARHRDGRGRPVSRSTTRSRRSGRSTREGSRSATLPRSGSRRSSTAGCRPSALREVADALDLTPAYCQAVASFYDMFHLEPVGTHLVEVCTNLSCALARRAACRRRVRVGARCRAGRDDRRTARSRSAPSSASAAAATRPSSPSTTATASTSARTTSPAIVEELRGRVRNVLLAGADEHDLTKLAEYRGDRRLRRRAEGARDDLGRADRRAPDGEPARPRRRRVPDGPQGVADRPRRARSRSTSSSTPTSRSRARSRTAR